MDDTGDGRIMDLVAEWLANHEEGTLIFSTSFLMELWEEKICNAFNSIGGIRMGLFAGVIEEITQIRNEERGIEAEDQMFLLWAAAQSRTNDQSGQNNGNPWNHPGLIKNISVMIKELKQAGVVNADLLTKALFPEAFAGIFKDYENILAALELFDYENAFNEACRLLELRGVPSHLRRVAVIGFQEFTAQQNRLLSILGSQGDLQIVNPSKLEDNHVSGCIDKPLTPDFIREMSLEIEGFTAADREWEVRGIAREVLRRRSQGVLFSNMAVVFRDTNRYQAIVKRVFGECRIPWTEPVTAAWLNLPVLSSLLLWLRLTHQTSPPTRAEMTFLFNQYFTGTFGPVIDQWLADDLSIARKSLTLAGWGAWLMGHAAEADSSFSIKLAALAQRCEAAASSMTLSQFWDFGREWIAGWEESPNASLERRSTGSDQEMRRALTESARDALLKTWDRWMAWTSRLSMEQRILSGESFAGILECFLADKVTSARFNTMDSVTLATPAQIQHTRYDSIFLGGLAEGEYPKRPSRSFLMSHESFNALKNMGYSLKSAEELLRGERQSFIGLLAGPARVLCLSTTLADLDGRALAPSAYFTEIKNLIVGKEGHWQHIGPSQPPHPTLGQPDANNFFPLDSGELTPETKSCILSERKRRRRDPGYSGMPGINPGVVKGLSKEFSGHYSFSPSGLKEFAVCPFGFFCHRVLRIQPPEEASPLPNPAELGSLYHDILKTFFERHRGERLPRSNSDAYVSEIQAIADEKTVEWADPSDSGGDPYILHRLQLASVKENLRHFIREELAWQEKTGWSFLPSIFEESFGTQDDPFILLADAAGEPVKITGKIDRVDRSRDGQAFIIFDYKTGGVPSSKEIADGLDLQLPIYLKAAERLLKPAQGMGAGYCSLKKHERTAGLWKKSWVESSGISIRNAKNDREWDDALQAAEGFIADHVSAIRRGDFRPAEGDCSEHCPYKAVCRRDFMGGESEDAAE